MEHAAPATDPHTMIMDANAVANHAEIAGKMQAVAYRSALMKG